MCSVLVDLFHGYDVVGVHLFCVTYYSGMLHFCYLNMMLGSAATETELLYKPKPWHAFVVFLLRSRSTLYICSFARIAIWSIISAVVRWWAIMSAKKNKRTEREREKNSGFEQLLFVTWRDRLLCNIYVGSTQGNQIRFCVVWLYHIRMYVAEMSLQTVVSGICLDCGR